ncbi:hypothetical protein [Frankia sp. CiP3]|uniref:hypothetical protein n=1 Tax=Frankia sp. CiP3 TaxID=2880971 RepID=UPI001EF4F5FE|nr:hypothetical protein [Frankia sp. CiP3]
MAELTKLLSSVGRPVTVYLSPGAALQDLAASHSKKYTAVIIDGRDAEADADLPESCAEFYDSHGLDVLIWIDPAEPEPDISTFHFVRQVRGADHRKLISFLDGVASENARRPGANYQHRLHEAILTSQPFPMRGRAARRLSSEILARWICVHPERILRDNELVSFWNDRAVLSGVDGRFNLALAFQSLSLCGEGLSLLAAIGRDLAVATTFRIRELRYCIQGPSRASTNSSTSRLLSLYPPADRLQLVTSEALRRRHFFALLSGARSDPTSPRIQARVLDVESRDCADDVISVREVSAKAWHIIRQELPEVADARVSGRGEVTYLLNLICRNSYGRDDASGKERAYLISSMKGVLGVAPFLDPTSLGYYFAEHEYLDSLTESSVLRVGPQEERNWDSSFELRPTHRADRLLGGVYARKHMLDDVWGLPYSYVSASVATLIAREPDVAERLLFVGDTDEDRIASLLYGAPPIETRRFISDLVSFVIFVAHIFKPCKDMLRHLPHPMNLDRNLVPPGSARYIGWIRVGLDATLISRRTFDCPAPLVPYLWTESELQAAIPATARFIARVSGFFGELLSPRNVRMLSRLACDGGTVEDG